MRLPISCSSAAQLSLRTLRPVGSATPVVWGPNSCPNKAAATWPTRAPCARSTPNLLANRATVLMRRSLLSWVSPCSSEISPCRSPPAVGQRVWMPSKLNIARVTLRPPPITTLRSSRIPFILMRSTCCERISFSKSQSNPSCVIAPVGQPPADRTSLSALTVPADP